MVAAADTDVADCHARLQSKKADDLAVLIQGVAMLLAGTAWADDLRHRALRCGKFPGGHSRRSQIFDVSGMGATSAQRQNKHHSADQSDQCSSAYTTTVNP